MNRFFGGRASIAAFAISSLLLLAGCGGNKKKQETHSGGASTDSAISANQPIARAFQFNTPRALPDSAEYTKQVITVSTLKELYDAVGSNRTIVIKSTAPLRIPKEHLIDAGHPNIKIDNGIEISGVHHLAIVGEGKTPVGIIQEDRTRLVLSFSNSNNVLVSNLSLGHVPEGSCGGNVLLFNKSEECHVQNSFLYGCGLEGITLTEARGVQVLNTEIYKNSSSMFSIIKSRDVVFYNTAFHDNINGSGRAYIGATDDLAFNNCRIKYNKTKTGPGGVNMFDIDDCRNLHMVNCEITDNEADDFSTHTNDFEMLNTTIKDNSWQKPKPAKRPI